MTRVYNLCARLIAKGNASVTAETLGVLLAGGSLTSDEYTQLVAQMNGEET